MSISKNAKKKKPLAKTTRSKQAPHPDQSKTLTITTAAHREAFQRAMLSSAESCIDRDWWVFPLHSIEDDGTCTCGTTGCGDAGKHPRAKRGLKEASKDHAQILAWFGPGAPLSNIGIVTGAVSNLTVLDIDIGEGKGGAESWQQVIGEHGEPQTLMAHTGSGGSHFLFTYNSALNTASNVLGKGIDCRNDGGYIVAAPSRHRSGGVYAWEEWSTPVVALPAHLARRKETRGRPKKDDMYRGKYSLEQVTAMLEVVPSDDRDLWRHMGIILGREFARIEAAWDLYVTWSEKAGGKKGRNHDEIMHEAFYELSQQVAHKELTIGTLVKAALDHGWVPKKGEVPVEQFVYYGKGNNYLYRSTGAEWLAAGVDAVCSPVNEDGKIIKATEWLKRKPITSLACDPLIAGDVYMGFDCRDGTLIPAVGGAVFNSYRRSAIEWGEATKAKPWVDQVRRLLNKPGDADQFINYMAHLAQRPGVKPRFALLIAGGQGTGKDTIIDFCTPTFGVWNVANIGPSAFNSNFNEFAAKLLVRISESADLHDMSKWIFYERTKTLIAGHPDECEINPKYGEKFSCRMYCGVILTTNHLSNGIHLPADDRRHDVLDCATFAEMGLEDEHTRQQYFDQLYHWFYDGGAKHIAAFLHARDLTGWSPDRARKTEAWRMVVQVNQVSDHWLSDILEDKDLMDRELIRVDWLVAKAVATGEKEHDVRRKIAATMGRAGYVAYRNPDEKDGRWKINSRRHMVYAKVGTPLGLEVKELCKVDPF